MTQAPQQDILEKFRHILDMFGVDRDAPRGEQQAFLIAIIQARMNEFGLEGDLEWLNGKDEELKAKEAAAEEAAKPPPPPPSE